jgi:hypothetical protein
MKYRIQYNRGYWIARDGNGRLVTLAFRRERLMLKVGHWLLQQAVDNTKATINK